MDFCDESAQREAAFTAERIAAARAFIAAGSGMINIYCVDCGIEIPKPRRKALPGCMRCVGCQKIAEG